MPHHLLRMRTNRTTHQASTGRSCPITICAAGLYHPVNTAYMLLLLLLLLLLHLMSPHKLPARL
jgi:hypothetical protein